MTPAVGLQWLRGTGCTGTIIVLEDTVVSYRPFETQRWRIPNVHTDHVQSGAQASPSAAEASRHHDRAVNNKEKEHSRGEGHAE